MTTTSYLTEEAQEVLLPDEDLMLEREGRDRRGIRRELAPMTEMDRGERYVEEGDGVYASPKTAMPTGTTSVGEVLGNVDIVRYTGEQIHIPRMTHGMTLDVEDLEIEGAEEKVSRAQDVVMESFDIQADIQFLLGITDEEGTVVQPDVFTWLDNHIDSNNIINAGDSSYDPYRTANGGVPANIIVNEAYSKTSGEYADDGWDFAIWDHATRARWNTIDNNSGVMQASQWLDMGSDAQNVGQSVVNDTVLVPDSIGLRTPPDDTNDALQFPISTFPSDTMYLIPDHGGDFFEMYEQPEPTLIDEPVRKEGGKVQYEYYWRAGHAFGFGSHRTDDGAGSDIAKDAIKITNVSTLF